MTAATAASRVPWRPAHLRVMLIGQALAVLLLAVAAYQAARTGSVEDGTDWMAFGVVGLAVAAIVSAAWLLTAKRRVIARRRRLTSAVAVAFPVVEPASAEAERFAPVAAPAMSHYHRPACQLVRGKDVTAASVIEHHQAKRTPCAVCGP